MRHRNRNRRTTRFEAPSEEKELLKKVLFAGVSVFVFLGVFTIKEAMFPEHPTPTYRAVVSAPVARTTTTTTTSTPTYKSTITKRKKLNETKSKTLGQTKAPLHPIPPQNTEKQQSRYVLDGK